MGNKDCRKISLLTKKIAKNEELKADFLGSLALALYAPENKFAASWQAEYLSAFLEPTQEVMPFFSTAETRQNFTLMSQCHPFTAIRRRYLGEFAKKYQALNEYFKAAFSK